MAADDEAQGVDGSLSLSLPVMAAEGGPGIARLSDRRVIGWPACEREAR